MKIIIIIHIPRLRLRALIYRQYNNSATFFFLFSFRAALVLSRALIVFFRYISQWQSGPIPRDENRRVLDFSGKNTEPWRKQILPLKSEYELWCPRTNTIPMTTQPSTTIIIRIRGELWPHISSGRFPVCVVLTRCAPVVFLCFRPSRTYLFPQNFRRVFCRCKNPF